MRLAGDQIQIIRFFLEFGASLTGLNNTGTILSGVFEQIGE
jgi:hypothetical protein